MKKIFTKLFALLLICFTVQTINAQTPAATPQEAIRGLLNRIGGNGAADKFVTIIDETLDDANGKDVFIITSQDSKPCIKGNNVLSVATGINWYLNHYARINLTWNNLTTDLTAVTLPLPAKEERHECNTKYRYNFNTCTFSYSMAFWTWERWQKEIDWMALHGINAPLNLVGLDVVTRNFLKELGVSDKDINSYIAGPGFIAWFAMNNLEGWGGTINAADVNMNGNPEWWYKRQEQLCRNMLQRMRELGMQPVIPGFSGQVPNCIVNYTINDFNKDDVINNGTWAGGYTRPDILKPSSKSYTTFASVYYKHLEAVMGVSEFYSIDPFHEGSLPSGVTNDNCYPNIMAHLDTYYNAVKEEVKEKFNAPAEPKWIIQYWQGVPQSGAFSAMSRYGDRFIGLDLFSDAPGKAQWNGDYFKGRPYIFCMLHNFGGRSGLHGRLESTMNDYFRALNKGNNMQGIGATPEGTETNPILYDMLFELPWINPNSRPTADEWLKEYAHARYGIENTKALSALQNLKKSVWNCPTDQQGTSEAVILARPSWNVDRVSSWSTSAIYWDTQDVLLAADELSSISDLITSPAGEANYNYDFIDVIRQAMVDYAAELLPLINAARNANNTNEYTRLYTLYLQLMLDLDDMLSYDENFKLERWTSLARNIADEAEGTNKNDRNWLEWNARTQVTVWSKGNTDLHDYSNRCWAGLIKDFHYKRWEKFFTSNGGSFNGGWYSGFEYPWTVNFTDYDYSEVTIPSDMSATEKANKTFNKYFGRVKGKEKNYIFPMGITTNATKSDVLPEVYRGQKVTLPLVADKSVTISSVWIDLNADGGVSENEKLTADGYKVEIPADAEIGKTKATVTFSDNTSITFNIALVEEITKSRTVKAVAENNGTVAIEGTDKLSITTTEAVKITATANTGYNFSHWTNSEGVTVSNDNPYMYYGKEAETFTAHFIQDKWGVVECEGALSGDIAGYKQFIHTLTFAYYNREATTIFEATSAPKEIFTTVPQIINIPRGASFDVEYDDGSSNGLQYCYFRAYIDLNSDGDFDDEGELLKTVGTSGATNTAVCSNKMNVLLPYDAPLGITHMRLRFDGAWNNPTNKGAKDASIRPVYDIILNITEFSESASHITVKSNKKDWGSVKVWTDETPDGSTRTEWEVTKGVPFFIEAIKSTEDTEFLGWYDQYGRLVTKELKYKMYAREDATYTAKFHKTLVLNGWETEYRTEGKNLILTKVNKVGDNDLVIPETVKLNSTYTITGFENGLFNDNKELWSITLPKSMQFLSIKEMLTGSMTGTVANGGGNENNYTIYNLAETINTKDGFVVTVNGISNGNSFNQWGSGLFASGTNPLKENYNGGFQFYLKKDGNFILKVNGSTELTLNNSNCKVIPNKEFTATIEYDGSTITITVDNGNGEKGVYTGKNVTLQDISSFSAAIPSGISLEVNVNTSKEENPFSGCSNLDAIIIDGECNNYYIENGDLYNSRGKLVCSPEGKEKGADRRLLCELIDEVEPFMGKIAEVSTKNKITLQTTESTKAGYLWANSIEESEGNIAHLVDGKKGNDDNFFHSNWHNVGTSEGYHYIEVDLGENSNHQLLQFSYHTRTNCSNDFPDAIEVMCSDNKQSYTTVYTVSSGLPQAVNKSFTSETFNCGKAYRYIRFKVSAERTYWHMGEFELYSMSAKANVFTHLEKALTDDEATALYNKLANAINTSDNGKTAEEMQAAYNALKPLYTDIKEKVKGFVLSPDKFYVIKSAAYNSYCKGKFVHTNYETTTHSGGNNTGSFDQRQLVFSNAEEIATFPLAVFRFEETTTAGEYKMSNLHTGMYVKSFNKNDVHMGTAAEAQNVKVSAYSPTQSILTIGSNTPMHAQEDYGVIVNWRAEKDNASMWSIEEVEDLSKISYTVTMGNEIYSTLFLNYPVAIPTGITAYIANEVIDNNWINLEEISDVIPAGTGVILTGDAADYNFEYYTAENTPCNANLLNGTLWEQVINKGNGTYYILANHDTDGIGFYNTSYSEETDKFSNKANKAYLHLSTTSNISFFGFRGVDNDNDDTTAIKEINSEKENTKTIYDLAGRRITAPAKGIYIIEGKKVIY